MSYCKEICLVWAPFTCQLVSANISYQLLFPFHQSTISANYQPVSASVPISYLPGYLFECAPSATFEAISAYVPHQLPSRLSLPVSPISYLPGYLCLCPPSASCQRYSASVPPSATFQPISVSVPHQLPASLSLPVSLISYLPAYLCQCPPSATCQPVSASVPHQLPVEGWQSVR